MRSQVPPRKSKHRPRRGGPGNRFALNSPEKAEEFYRERNQLSPQAPEHQPAPVAEEGMLADPPVTEDAGQTEAETPE